MTRETTLHCRLEKGIYISIKTLKVLSDFKFKVHSYGTSLSVFDTFGQKVQFKFTLKICLLYLKYSVIIHIGDLLGHF